MARKVAEAVALAGDRTYYVGGFVRDRLKGSCLFVNGYAEKKCKSNGSAYEQFDGVSKKLKGTQ